MSGRVAAGSRIDDGSVAEPKDVGEFVGPIPATGLSRRISAAFVNTDAVTLGDVPGREGAVSMDGALADVDHGLRGLGSKVGGGN